MNRSSAASETGSLLVIPYLVFLALIIFDNVPSNINGIERLEIGLCFASLFFISLTSEGYFTAVWVALFGLFNDLISDTPIGYWAFIFIIFYGLSSTQRPLLQAAAFGSHWVTYAVLISITYFVGFLVAVLRDDMVVGSLTFFLSALAAIAAFPLVYWPLYRFRDAIVRGDKN